MIEPGSPAPEVSLSDYRGRTVVLVFYPADFSRVCTDQLSVYQEVLPQLEEAGAQLVGISVDGAFCHKAFREHQGLTIPLLADFHPKGEVAKAYGVLSEEYGVAGRALVMVGPDGVVQWSYLSPPLEVPGANLIFDALEQRTPA
jgi:peroxiredoxin